MKVRVEVLYSPTCANHLVWMERINEAAKKLGERIVVEEINVWEQPEALERYRRDEQVQRWWKNFMEGYIHYFMLVVVNSKVIDWYWNVEKVTEAIKKEIEGGVG